MPPEMPDMALEGLGAEDPMAEGDDMAMTVTDDGLGELDPQFAADAAEAFPDLDDAQLTALQRAVQGLLGR